MLAGTSGDHFEFPACWVLGISKDWGSRTSLGNLRQCSATLTLKCFSWSGISFIWVCARALSFHWVAVGRVWLRPLYLPYLSKSVTFPVAAERIDWIVLLEGHRPRFPVCGSHFEFTTNLFAFGFYQTSGTTCTTEIEIFQSSRKELNCSSLTQIFNVLLFFPTLNLHSQVPIWGCCRSASAAPSSSHMLETACNEVGLIPNDSHKLARLQPVKKHHSLTQLPKRAYL